MKKIIAMLLILSSLFILASCGEENRKYNEEEVKEAASLLIYKSQEFNQIFWGAGLAFIEGSEYDNGVYSPAEPHRDYESISEIMSEAEKVFSKGYLDSVRKTIFAAQFGDTGISSYIRYYQVSENEPIMVRTDYKPILKDENKFLYDTVNVLGSKGDIVEVVIKLEVTRGDLTQTIDRKIGLIEENGVWKLDTHTFANYNENL